MSTSVPLGETALFMCAGKAKYGSVWLINGFSSASLSSKDRGAAVTHDFSNYPLYQANLTIPGTVENDNVSIQCGLVDVSNADPSRVVYLTVLGQSYMYIPE